MESYDYFDLFPSHQLKNSYSISEILNIFKYRVTLISFIHNYSGIIICLKEILMIRTTGQKPKKDLMFKNLELFNHYPGASSLKENSLTMS